MFAYVGGENPKTISKPTFHGHQAGIPGRFMSRYKNNLSYSVIMKVSLG
jgi:hypothetical protein